MSSRMFIGATVVDNGWLVRGGETIAVGDDVKLCACGQTGTKAYAHVVECDACRRDRLMPELIAEVAAASTTFAALPDFDQRYVMLGFRKPDDATATAMIAACEWLDVELVVERWKAFAEWRDHREANDDEWAESLRNARTVDE